MFSRPLALLPFDHAGAEQLEWDDATGDITYSTPAAQSFRCAHDRLHRIEVFIEPTFHFKRCHLWLQVFAGERQPDTAVAHGEPLRIVGPLAAEKIIVHGWVNFEFEPIAASGGKMFTFVLAAPDAAPGNALSFRRTGIGDRGFSLGGRSSDGALLFRAICLRAPAMLPNFRRYLRAARDPQAAVNHTPLMVAIETSRPCNLHCVMCHRGLTPFNPRREGAAFLSLATFQTLDAILPDLLWIIAFGLGEPFLNPEYLSILRHARARNPFLHVFTSTNGTCLTDETLEAIVNEDLVSTFQISLDGAERATFEAIRKNASHDTVIRCFERVVAARERARPGMRVRASMLVMKPTIGQVFDFIRQMADRGVDLVSFGTPKDSAFQHLRADSPDEMARIYEQLVRGHEYIAGSRTLLDGPLLAEIFTWHRNTGQTDTPPRWGHDEAAALASTSASHPPTPCGIPWESFNLSADGDIRVCCNSYRVMGKLPAESFSALWQQGGPYGQLRTELLTRNLHHDCATCLGGVAVTVDEVTPATYRAGAISDSGITAAIANLIGRNVDRSDAAPPQRTRADVRVVLDSVEQCSAAPEVAAGSSWRIHGSLETSGAFDTTEPLLLAVAADGTVRTLAVAILVSAQQAQFSAVIPGYATAGSTARTRVEIFQITREAGELQLWQLLSAPPSISWPERLEAFPRCGPSTPVQGFVDELRIVADTAHLIGWTRDATRHAPARKVVALVDGRLLRGVRPWLNRPDVARAYSDSALEFGFILELPLERLRRAADFGVLGVDAAGAACELNWGATASLALARETPLRKPPPD